MPELPEVEALVGDLRGRLDGHAFARLMPLAISALKTYDPPMDSMAGLLVDGVRRHGKFLDIEAGGLHLVIHLARGGWLRWHEQMPSRPPRPGGKSGLAMRVWLDDDSGFDLTEGGTQKRLAIYVVRDPAEVPGIARLGPDPLDETFTAETLAGILKEAGRSQIKGVLRNQSVIAGIGNAYSDEILHVARMSPYKPAASFDDADLATLYDAIGSTLRDAVERSEGMAAADLKKEKKTGLRVHGRAGQACPVCGDTIREVSFADSSLQYCPTCQTGGKPLADRRMSRLLK
ncbi:MAG TPA: DNA-formamidopyrimidine glycosylase family protein [Nocardioidaceae bacterium]|nr:DNA-formamidopyrimidine glycosylase family protein [Nocardioidaceae bacterium]